MDKKEQFSNDLDKKDVSKKMFLLNLNKISSDLSFALSLSAFLGDKERHDKDLAVVNNVQKLRNGLEQEGRRLENISYEQYRELFESIIRNGDVLKTCKETYTSRVKCISSVSTCRLYSEMKPKKISKEGKDFSLAIKILLQWVNNREYENVIEDHIHTIRNKLKSEENELYKAEIASLAEKRAIENSKQLQEYENEKKWYEELLVKIDHESHLNRVQIEMKNKNDMSTYSEHIKNDLEELENSLEEKQSTLVVSQEANMVETENMNKNLLKKEMLLDVINKRYNNDMLMRFNQRESLQLTIKSKINLFQTFKVKVMSMEMYLKELEENEKMYLKQKFSNKLDAIREKIALRTISKFLIPYVNLKFKSRRLKMSKKKKTKNQKKL